MDAVRLLICAVVIAAAACTSGPQPMDESGYEREIMAWRAAKNAMLASEPDSPLLPADRAGFTGLPYWPVNSTFRMAARLEEDRSNTHIIELPTSSTELRRMQRVGSLHFSFAGRPLTLTAFADEGVTEITRLFVPFGDLTSGTETYQGGRYLDLTRTPTGFYDLDFNRAYHPYCVYNINYVCPVPPRENRLDVAIRAGERYATPKSQP